MNSFLNSIFFEVLLVISISAFLTSCGGNYISAQPSISRLEGEWVQYEISKELRSKNINSSVGNLILHRDGRFEANGLAVRDPLRLMATKGSWRVAGPTVTPSGKWSVELDGPIFLVVTETGGDLLLHHTVDPVENLRVSFKRLPLGSRAISERAAN